ncbi:MAG: peptidylprolyl isomerase [Holosporaceae bacterium]|nr:peptidylprolyl isomerase [Holosporaceae bacterium]
MKKIFYTGLVACSFVLSPCSVCDSDNKQAQEYDGIVAVVNDDIITASDLEERLRLTLFSSGGEVASELKSRILREVLKEMIAEKLKWQCASKYSPKGGWISEEAVKASFDDIAKRNGMTHDEFCNLLKNKKINKDVLLKQIQINLSWIAYVNARFGKFINISQSEMNRTMAEIKEKRDQESYYVRRMFFPVSDPKNESEVLARVNNLYHMLERGADFGNLARQFSQSPEASKGGEMGWVFQGQLSSEENSALGKMQIGKRAIVRTSRGYAILFLQDKKEAGLSSFTTLKIAQVVIPFRGPNPPKEEVDQLRDFALELKKSSRSCHEFMAKAKESGFCGVSDSASVNLESMAPEFRTALSSLQAGGIGNPIVTPNGLIVICVLDRKTQKIPELTREEVMAQKTNERLSVFADRETRDLGKRAVIAVNEKYGTGFDFSN